MNRPTELIEKLKVSSKAATLRPWKLQDGGYDNRHHIEAASPENILALLRWVEVLERALEKRVMVSDGPWHVAAQMAEYVAEAARELEARDDTKMVSNAKVE